MELGAVYAVKGHHWERNGCSMDMTAALAALTALSHPTRLQAFRLLVSEGPNGLTAGALAELLDVTPPTLSFHLKELDRAGLLRSWRRQRHIHYAVDIAGMRRFLTYLTEDCCQGHPEICGDLATESTFCTSGEDRDGSRS